MREWIKNPNNAKKQKISKRIGCLMNMEENLFYKRLALEIYPKVRKRNKGRGLKYYYTRKDKLFQILGGAKCIRCGFNDIRALQFDHINGDGLIERRNGHKIYLKEYVDNPELAKKKLQVLCANCNWIKRHENKEHGHKDSERIRKKAQR